eukprot:jgi/Mesen1/4051/ME000213S03067
MAAQILFPWTDSWLLNGLAIQFAAAGVAACMQEASGKKNMGYSKFAKKLTDASKQVSSRAGMLAFYTPPAVMGGAALGLALGGNTVSSFLGVPPGFSLFGIDPHQFQLGMPGGISLRFALVCAAITAHFSKRVLETLFVHRYSGSMDTSTLATVTLGYSVETIGVIAAQLAAERSPPPGVDLMGWGVAACAVGLVGNGYHHYLLSRLRKEGDKGYKVPQGGLFPLVTCPHYLFEIIDYIGVAMIAQTWMGVGQLGFVVGYLSGRSIAQRRWYLEKVDDYPKDRKCLVPFLF